MLDSRNHMLLTDGVMGWNSSQQTHCAKILTGHVISIITTQALSGCQNSHYTTEKGKAFKAFTLRELNVACSEVLHHVGGWGGVGGGWGGGWGVGGGGGGWGVGGGGGGGCHIHTITLPSKVLLSAVYYSDQSSLNAVRCNLFNKRWDMQNGMC